MAEGDAGEEKFSDLKADLSKNYKGNKYLWLRLVLFGQLALEDITCKDIGANDLLNSLQDKGVITPTKVQLLFEIATLTELNDAVDIVIQYMKDNNVQSRYENKLSSYRGKLFKALRQVDPDAFKCVIAYYKLKDLDFQNIWDTVLKLEIRGDLADEPDKIKRFACCLGQRAKNILLDRGVVIQGTINFPPNTNSSLSLLNTVSKYVKQHFNRLNHSIWPFFKFNGLGVKDPKSSLVFRLYASNREALRQLQDMHMKKELIKGLADIFVAKNKKDFLDTWTTNIDDKEYMNALRELTEKEGSSPETEQEKSDEGSSPETEQEKRHGVQLLLSLVRNQSCLSANDHEQPNALELLFKLMEKQKEFSTKTVKEVHKIIKQLTIYFERMHIEFKKVETGSIVLHLVSYDTEALEELWKMYSNQSLQRDLTQILVTDEDQNEPLICFTIHKQDYEIALQQLEEFEELDMESEELFINIKEEQRSPKSLTESESEESSISYKEEHTSPKSQTDQPGPSKRFRTSGYLKDVPKYYEGEMLQKEYEDLPKAMEHEVEVHKEFLQEQRSQTAILCRMEESITQFRSSSNIMDGLRDLCQEFSNAYLGDTVKELRFLLHDHLPVGELSKEHYTGMSLFNDLKSKGLIAYNDVTLMSEIADVTKNVAAKASVKKYKKSVGDQYDDSGPCEASLTLERKTLYKAMIAITENVKGDLNELIQFYNLGTRNFTNKWDLVFYLEKELELNTKAKLATFAQRLHKGPRTILLGDEDQGTSGGLPAANVGVTQAAALPERPPLTHLNIDLSKDDLLELLVALSEWVTEEGNIYMLKLLLAHFSVISVGDIEKAKSPFDLFKLLIAPGLISGKNIDLIIEVFSLCGWYDAADVIRKKVTDFKEIVKGMEITKFSQFRQNVIVFGRMLGINKIKKICQLYRIIVNQIVDQWDLLVELDSRAILESKGFIEKLKGNGMEKEANVLQKGI